MCASGMSPNRQLCTTANGQPRLSPDVVGILVNRLRVPQLAAEPPRPTRLSQREREIVENLVRGRTNAEIGELLGISEKTVKNHVNHVYAKLHTRNRAETARCAMTVPYNRV